MKWLDFSAYGLKLYLLKTPTKHYLVLAGENALPHKDAARKLRFEPLSEKHPNLLTRGVRLKADGTLETSDAVTLAAYRAAFPNAVEVDYDEQQHYKDQSHTVKKAPAPPAGAGAQPAMTGNVRRLGSNAVGQEVLEADNGRFARDDRGRVYPESESHGNPGLFLRANDEDSLAVCADGFVEQTLRNFVLRADDFEKFVTVVYGEPAAPGSARFAAARSAVEAASGRLLARKGGGSLSQAFIVAAKLSENLAFLSDGRGQPVTGMPAPVAVAAQRLLGTEAALKGKQISIHNPGFGHVLSHLSRHASLLLSGNVPQREIAAALKTVGMPAETVAPGSPPPVADFQAADLKREVASKPVATSIGEFKRADYAAFWEILSRREADGNTAIVIDPPEGPEEAAEFDRLRDGLAQRYSFDGECRVSGSLWSGRADSPDKIMVSVGWRRQKPVEMAFPATSKDIQNWGELWTWTADVATSRAQIDREEDIQSDVQVQFNAGTESQRNQYQVPYVSASRLGTPSTMVPRNLEGAMREALAKIIRLHGDIDEWVAKEYGYTTEEMKEIFSPEQIDSLALHVHAEDRGRGFLVADQMGIGKGRQLAAMMRRAIMHGQKVMFMTEKQTNLSDIIRDLMHTKSLHLVKPMIVNDQVSIIDERTKKVVMRSTPRPEVDAMLESGRWPGGYNLVLGTYSQFQSEVIVDKPSDTQQATVAAAVKAEGKDPSAKSRWLTTALDKETKLVIDECHNAASGTSNVSRNLTQAASSVASVVYSSATFAHKAQHMAFYRSLLPDEMSTDELATMLEKGGETFQEVLSGMLVHDGVMVRREFDLSKIVIQTKIDTVHKDRNRGYMDALAPILAEVIAISVDVEGRVREMNEHRAADANRRAPAQPAEQAGEEGEPRAARVRRRRTGMLTRVGQGAPLYTVSRLFVASLRVDAVAEEAIEALKRNEKPVILVESTIQTLLEEVAENEDDSDENAVPDFRTVLTRILRQVTTVRDKDEHNNPIKRDMARGIPEIAAKADRIREMIEKMPHLPVSAIDEVKHRIENAGFTCGEITGRSLEVRDGRVMRRSVPNPTVVKNAFNSGELDAIIINTAGSTGIDLHAGQRFKDQRQRHLIELQAPADVLRKVQGYGRVTRFGQTSNPKITKILTGLPVETRLAAMENAHLRRLSANTTSDRDAAMLTRGIPDLINPIGDIVCSRYAEARPDLMRKLGLKVSEVEAFSSANLKADKGVENDLKRAVTRRKSADNAGPSEGVADTKRTANEILSRLIMLPVAVQEKVCAELTAEFRAAIEELEAKGMTPLRTQELPGKVHPRKDPQGNVIRTAFEGAEVENADSIFNEPLYIMDASIERTGTPIKSDNLLQLIAIGDMGSGRMQPCVDRLRDGMNEILEAYLPDGVPDVATALERNIPKIVDRKAKIEALIATVKEIKPGSEIRYTVDEMPISGIVTKVDYPDRGFEHVPGMYGIEFAVAGDEKPRSMRLETLMKDAAFGVKPGLQGESYDADLKKFDDAVNVKLTSVKILLNNIYRGMKVTVEHGLGSLRTFRMADGTVHRGIVISQRHHDINLVPVEITGPAMARAAIEKGIELSGDPKLKDRLLMVRDAPNDHVEFRLPTKESRKYGYIYDDARIKALARRDVNPGKGQTIVKVTKNEAVDILDSFHKVGARFWCNSASRTWANQWLTEHGQAKKQLLAPVQEEAEPQPEPEPVGVAP